MFLSHHRKKTSLTPNTRKNVLAAWAEIAPEDACPPTMKQPVCPPTTAPAAIPAEEAAPRRRYMFLNSDV